MLCVPVRRFGPGGSENGKFGFRKEEMAYERMDSLGTYCAFPPDALFKRLEARGDKSIIGADVGILEGQDPQSAGVVGEDVLGL
jgi:hypothetical protein